MDEKGNKGDKGKMEKGFAVSGLHVGEHSFQPERLTEEFEARGIGDLSFLTIRTRSEQVEPRYFYEWARWCRDHQVYFMFLYTVQNAPKGKESQFTPEMVARMREIAGEYFLGDQFGEIGSVLGATPRGYTDLRAGMPQGLADMQEAHDTFLAELRRSAAIDQRLGMPGISMVEATALIRYTFQAGCTLPLLETMPGDPEFLISLTRGCAYAYDTPIWGTYIAQEWYGGLRNDDPLKYRRLKAAYRYAYLSGSHVVCLESGDERIQSFGYDYPAEHPFCRAYRDESRAYERALREQPRPAAEPEVRVALVYGNLDAFTSWQGGAVWNQYDRDEWSYGPAEWSWRITEDLRHARSWQEVENYGAEDLSAAPGFGLYDVIPADCPAERMRKYDTVIFVGWNTMTPEIYENLRIYVENGGHVLLTAAHLNTNVRRDGAFLPIFGGQTEDFLGCNITGTERINYGVKFLRDCPKADVLWPLLPNGQSDPIGIAGVHTAAKTALTGAQASAVYHDTFSAPTGAETPAVVEHRLGEGVVTLMTAAEYPGHNAVWPLYRMLVRELVTASHRRCPIHVRADDKLRFAVYRTADTDAVCLLNTDFTNTADVTIEAYGETRRRRLEPCEVAWERFARE